MRILTVDIGTGTQDIFLYDSRLDVENGYKLVLPSPTMMINRRLKEATRQKQTVLLTGGLMGGGPNQWAAEAHVQAGLSIYATPEAALSFNDDLSAVKALGICIISEDEAARLPVSILRLEMRDFDFVTIQQAFALFGVSLSRLDAIAVAVFDHGNAPPQVSDRQFRFDYLDQRIRTDNRLSAFAYLADEIPSSLTRMQAVAACGKNIDAPIIVMDTAPAAILGATYDLHLSKHRQMMIANIGNLHTLAFRLNNDGIDGFFEHHTGLLDLPSLEDLLRSLAAGSLRHADVFDHHGHGALTYNPKPLPLGIDDFDVAVTGPRRSLIRGSKLRVYHPAPFGDMMITGCFGLLSAVSHLLPHLAEPIQASLRGRGESCTPPWDIAD